MHRERNLNPDRSAESLEARLRALPSPPVPADLEGRLLAAVPAPRPVTRRRWAVWVGIMGALAAACLLAVLAWLGRDGKTPGSNPATAPAARQETPRTPDDSDNVAAWQKARRGLGVAGMPAFAW